MRLRHAWDVEIPLASMVTRPRQGLPLRATKFSTRPRRGLLLGHDEAESDGLLLVCGEVFYSSAARAFTRPREGLPPPATKVSTRPRQGLPLP